MIVSTLIAATVAAAEPQVAPSAPAPPHADHKAAGQADKKMACCDKMAKGEGCDCCKGMEKAEAAPAHGEHDGHRD